MDTITMSEVTELTDPKLKAIAKRVLQTFQVAAEKAVAHEAESANFPMPAAPDAAERIFHSRLKSLSPVQRQTAVLKVMASIKAPEAKRVAAFGELGKINLRSAVSVADEVKKLAMPTSLKFPMSHLTAAVAKIHGGVASSGTPASATAVTDNLEFRAHKVKCVDETNPEAFGDDEIMLGGATIDESGDTGKIPQFMVGNSFDDGEQKVYSPPKRLCSFNLNEGTTFPKSYFVTLALAEKDMGGFGDFLTQLYDKIKGRVIEAIAAAIGAAIGSTIPGLGTIVGAVVGWVLGKLVAWIIGLFSDDVFPPVTLSINIPSLNARWPGGKTDSPEKIATWTGHGGKYQLTYDWRLFA